MFLGYQHTLWRSYWLQERCCCCCPGGWPSLDQREPRDRLISRQKKAQSALFSEKHGTAFTRIDIFCPINLEDTYRSRLAQLVQWAAWAGCGSCYPEGSADRPPLFTQEQNQQNSILRCFLQHISGFCTEKQIRGCEICYLPERTDRVLHCRHYRECRAWAGCWGTRSLCDSSPRPCRSSAPEIRKNTTEERVSMFTPGLGRWP